MKITRRSAPPKNRGPLDKLRKQLGYRFEVRYLAQSSDGASWGMGTTPQKAVLNARSSYRFNRTADSKRR